MMTPETLAAAERVAQYGAQRAMLAARQPDPSPREGADAEPALHVHPASARTIQRATPADRGRDDERA